VDLSPSTPSELRPLLDNPSGVGLSTGAYADLRGDWPALFAAVGSLSPQVAELSALSASELPPLVAFMLAHPDLLGPQYSVHAPSKGLGPLGLLAVADSLLRLSPLTPRIIVHPDAIGGGLSILHLLGDKVALENMDSRKSLGRSTASMQDLFDRAPRARFCLDVAHAYSIDPTLALAHELLDAFNDRLVQVHLSGIDADGHHQPLSLPQLDAYRPVLARCHHVPWILESHLS
jgi:hypothetical protein